MTTRPIGYYVHHHGAGHRSRARAIAGAASDRIVLLGTGVGSAGVELADDRPISGAFDGDDQLASRPDALHYAPLDHVGVRSRVATIARWIETNAPSLMVVDVSVEIAMLARLASVPVVYVRLNGERSDAPHVEAFRSAAGLLAPFHESLDALSTPGWIREKTRYLPGITGIPTASIQCAGSTILVVIGRGGRPGDGEALAQAASHCARWRWRVIGPCSIPHKQPANLDFLGWVEDASVEIAQAALVIGAAGDGLVAGILAADRPFICIPQERPFGEQHVTALRLGELGAAIALLAWPSPQAWPALIDRALALPSAARRRLHNADGVQVAADWICAIGGAHVPAQVEAA